MLQGNCRAALVGLFLSVASAMSAMADQDRSTPSGLSPEVARQIDQTVTESLAKTGAPSVSVAIVMDGKLAYAKAYGLAQISPARPASAEYRYAIASNSKAFTAAAVLMLVDQGKMSLDDHVSRWFPDLTSADQVTVRQLLSHTSGYSDYWPQDYVMTPMLSPTTPEAIIDAWARKPLDYGPGEAWQYSNTGYVIAARIVEKVSGQGLYDFLQAHVFKPLHMSSVVDNDQHRIMAPDTVPYTRLALGPSRPAPREGAGWMYGAGELAMTASDLARWDISIIDRSLMSKTAYEAMTRPVALKSGADSGYGLGLFVDQSGGRLTYHHGGEVSGFLSENRIYPDDHAAIVVQSSSDAASAQKDVAARIAFVLLPPRGEDATTRRLLDGLTKGAPERSLMTANLGDYFSAQAVSDAQKALVALGPLRALVPRGKALRGGMTYRGYHAVFAKGAAEISTYFTSDGKLEQFLIEQAGD